MRSIAIHRFIAATVIIILQPVGLNAANGVQLSVNKSMLTNNRISVINPRLKRTLLHTLLVSPKQNVQQQNQKEASGPDATHPVDLVSALIGIKGLDKDFQQNIGWDSSIYPDSTKAGIYYYLPREYRIKRDPDPNIGYQLRFVYGYSSSSVSEAKVSLNVTLAPPEREGDLALLNELAKHAPGIEKNIELRPFPMQNAKVEFDSLKKTFGIADDDISIRAPKSIRDPIELSISMKESVMQEVVTFLRNGGLRDGVVLIDAGTANVQIPINFELDQFSGPITTDFSNVGPGHPLRNLGPLPITLKGFVVYSKHNSVIERSYTSFRNPVYVPPGATRTVPNFRSMVKGVFLMAWFDLDQDSSCQSCFDAVEKQLLAVAGLTRKDTLTIEAIPNIFSDMGIFKIVIEVKSPFFTAANDDLEVHDVVLKKDAPSKSLILYIDKDKEVSERRVSYRYEIISTDGKNPAVFSRWRESDTLDITITPRDLSDGGR